MEQRRQEGMLSLFYRFYNGRCAEELTRESTLERVISTVRSLVQEFGYGTINLPQCFLPLLQYAFLQDPGSLPPQKDSPHTIPKNAIPMSYRTCFGTGGIYTT